MLHLYRILIYVVAMYNSNKTLHNAEMMTFPNFYSHTLQRKVNLSSISRRTFPALAWILHLTANMSSTNHIGRNRLDILFNQVANPDKAPIADDGHHINNPSELNILRIPQYDFEHLDVGTNPHILFTPVPLSEIQKYFINLDKTDEGRMFVVHQDRPDDRKDMHVCVTVWRIGRLVVQRVF